MITQTALKRPLILTLWMEDQAQQYFNELREQYFPPERNYLQAHMTLFHALPDEEETVAAIESFAARQKEFPVFAERIVSIGNGTAVKLYSKELSNFHLSLQHVFAGLLSAQDKQKLWPHVTIQNKVDKDIAKKTFEKVNTSFQPFEFTAFGIESYWYCGGPWQAIKKIKFGEGFC